MSRCVSLALFAFMLCSASCATYPSTYPFENEAVQVPELLDSTPSLTFDDQDPGGYMLLNMACDLNDPTFFSEWKGDVYDFCDGGQHWLYNSYGVAKLVPSDFNCTDTTTAITADTFLYTIAGSKVCDNCCDFYQGAPNYGTTDDSVADVTQFWDSASAAASCAVMNEPAYCTIVVGQIWLCINNFLSAGERVSVIGCIDGLFNFYMSCALYKGTGIKELLGPEEPESYFAQLTAEQTMVIGAVSYNYDRVCHPYSYYYPETIVSGGDDSSANDGGDGGDDSESFAMSLSYLYTLTFAFFMM